MAYPLVAVYLSALAARGQAAPSIARVLAAIAHHHRRAGTVSPHRAEGGLVIAGIRRSRVLGPERKAAADTGLWRRSAPKPQTSSALRFG